jgi:hypothetical protein
VIYCYRRPDGRVEEVVMSIAEMERRQRPDDSIILDDGTVAQRDFKAEFCGASSCPGAWPLESKAAGVDPSQIGEYQKYLRESGVPTNYTPTGEPVFTSRGHLKRALKALGLHDNDGGFGD